MEKLKVITAMKKKTQLINLTYKKLNTLKDKLELLTGEVCED
jgi:hypothetical protein